MSCSAVYQQWDPLLNGANTTCVKGTKDIEVANKLISNFFIYSITDLGPNAKEIF